MKNFKTKDLMVIINQSGAASNQRFDCEPLSDEDHTNCTSCTNCTSNTNRECDGVTDEDKTCTSCSNCTSNTNPTDCTDDSDSAEAMKLKATAKAMELYKLKNAVATLQNRIWA